MTSYVKQTALTLLTAGMLMAGAAHAVPSLQLDIEGGSYNSVDETTVTDNPTFNLLALGLKGSVSTTDDYYLSVALLPATTNVGDPANLGAVTVNGVALSSLGLSEFGNPPIDAASSDLASHGIYDTFYYEFAFSFSGDPEINAYNTADGSSASGKLYKSTFAIDASALASGYGLHFDLYTYGPKNDKIKITDFAPFSHDAAYCLSTRCEPPTTQVPEPATLSLLGLGLVAVGARRRRR